MHLTISVLLQEGQLKTVVPLALATLFLHDEQSNFFVGMIFGILGLFIKLIVWKSIDRKSVV